jgi:uncharacterized membrane protein
MKWFRSKAKYGARLALFALAVQFVLSFGHFHWDAAQAAQAINAVTALPSASQPDASVQPAAKSAQTQPANDHPAKQHPHDTCAICTVMAMAGSAMFAEPPLLMLPQAYHFLYLTTDAEFSHLATQHVDFQPRAPPTS